VYIHVFVQETYTFRITRRYVTVICYMTKEVIFKPRRVSLLHPEHQHISKVRSYVSSRQPFRKSFYLFFSRSICLGRQA
jgi:hypothetical protein